MCVCVCVRLAHGGTGRAVSNSCPPVDKGVFHYFGSSQQGENDNAPLLRCPSAHPSVPAHQPVPGPNNTHTNTHKWLAQSRNPSTNASVLECQRARQYPSTEGSQQGPSPGRRVQRAAARLMLQDPTLSHYTHTPPGRLGRLDDGIVSTDRKDSH